MLLSLCPDFPIFQKYHHGQISYLTALNPDLFSYKIKTITTTISRK